MIRKLSQILFQQKRFFCLITHNFLKKEDVNHELSDSSTIETNSSSLIQSIDHIKLFSSLNPYDFGVISYLHSQNDILSGGGSVKSLSISLSLPFSEGATEKFYMDT